LYEGPLELSEGDERCELITLRHGMRSVHLSERGLRINGQPLRLQGVCAESFSETDARRWHDEQINFVLTLARDDSVELLKIADGFGLFVLGRIDEPHHWPRWPLACQRHPSFLGSVLTATARIGENRPAGPGLVGAEVEADRTAPAGQFDFIVVEHILHVILGMPTIFKVASNETSIAASDQIIGWLRESR